VKGNNSFGFLLSNGVNADFQDFKYEDITEKIIKAFYQVYNTLGCGFLSNRNRREQALKINLRLSV